MKKHLFSSIVSVIVLVVLLVPINSWQKLIIDACLMWAIYVIYLLNSKALKGGQPNYSLIFGCAVIFSCWVFLLFLSTDSKLVLPAFWAAHKMVFYLLTTFPIIFVVIAALQGYRLFKQLLRPVSTTTDQSKELTHAE